MCKCREKREARIEQRLAYMQSALPQNMTMVQKEELKEPIYIEYVGNKGITPFVGGVTRFRYYFGKEKRFGWVEQADIKYFVGMALNGAPIFKLSPEPKLVKEEEEIVPVKKKRTRKSRKTTE